MLGIAWVENDDISKLLGMAFGLLITSEKVDGFLLDRINQFQEYWSTTKVNPTERGALVNGVFLSSTYFFTSVWGGT